jgi:hypothetical protein
MEKKLIKLAEQYGCNNVRYIGKIGNTDYYVPRWEDDATVGMPVFFAVTGNDIKEITGNDALSFLDKNADKLGIK